MAPFGRFARELLSDGYRDLCTAELLRLMGHLSGWMASVNLLDGDRLVA